MDNKYEENIDIERVEENRHILYYESIRLYKHISIHNNRIDELDRYINNIKLSIHNIYTNHSNNNKEKKNKINIFNIKL